MDGLRKTNSQQISNIAESNYRMEGAGTPVPQAKTSQFSYDANGNLLSISTATAGNPTNNRTLLWDEENHLLASNDNGFVTSYFYDAGGERTVKMSGDAEGVKVNGLISANRTSTNNFSVYISPYMIVRNGGEYTKNIYMGSQRVMSKVSNSGIFATSPVNTTDLQAKYAAQTVALKGRYNSLGVAYNATSQTGSLISQNPSTASSSYYYHSDHLGSSSLITDASGGIVQHLEYVPYGETFIDERRSASSWTTPYLFCGKERDTETGLLYVSQRYQDGKYGIWYSVDPLAEKYPNNSSYVYCHDNPLKYIDPDGRSTNVVKQKNGTFKVVGGDLNDKDKGIYVGTQDDKGNFTRSSDKPMGETMTMTSFYNSDKITKNGKKQEVGWQGTIDTKDMSGKKFLRNLMKNIPAVGIYAFNARNGYKYDFKSTNGTDKGIYDESVEYYRGMPIGKSNKSGLTVYTSARDVGNFGAGYVAAKNHLTWGDARLGFDTYNYIKNKEYPEGLSTQNAERAGFNYGTNK